MAKNQKSYTPEFKQQIVDLYNAGGTSYPQLEHEYGVSKSTLSTWVNPSKSLRNKLSLSKNIKRSKKKINALRLRMRY